MKEMLTDGCWDECRMVEPIPLKIASGDLYQDLFLLASLGGIGTLITYYRQDRSLPTRKL